MHRYLTCCGGAAHCRAQLRKRPRKSCGGWWRGPPLSVWGRAAPAARGLAGRRLEAQSSLYKSPATASSHARSPASQASAGPASRRATALLRCRSAAPMDACRACARKPCLPTAASIAASGRRRADTGDTCGRAAPLMGLHCDHHSVRTLHCRPAAQHVGPCQPWPPHCCHSPAHVAPGCPVGSVGGAAAGGSCGPGAPPSPQLVSHVCSHGWQCDHHSPVGMHHVPAGQHASPVKPSPPHWAYSALAQPSWPLEGVGCGLGPEPGT
mmetsp:Transcript_37312/g.112647  ORF Transcript_37312/g.112647 Transcript_37312/m.112647 type:complete len:267 (+) Transcript_37312:151-951(+)